ncbi:SET domain-containing protein [Dictyostelium discoideum AX4]|uniref:SET domain-containing protein DDB_G0283443 n=1 Tax=Dictyostelium discoideum TaxID=44689 RepID=Y3443_DICDI|nr:SET domain-containing protein [Dictyostelium discoideum AX4]Q54R14.1 RecName: Full=SET domain-containing protein DDB_G0283443 [Dictyostelium discoideum]EAL65706.1 SET domain-containing protein [Dictyostelium discoideum AX4]|eukprot:XP_639077.1 SET domain-containing protein [Dictyostelium discoideum AX4]
MENNNNNNKNDNEINFKKIEINETLESGKFIESKIDMKLGELIIKVQSPMCFSFHKHLVNQFCFNCFSNSHEINNAKFNKFKVDINKNYIIRCNNCKLIYFCSDECFEKVMSIESFQDSTSTNIHTPLECLILSNYHDQTISPKINTLHDQTENRMIINYLSKIAYSTNNNNKFKLLLIEMNQLIGDFNNDNNNQTLSLNEIKNIKNKSFNLRKLFNNFFFNIDKVIIEELYAKSQRNSFGLWKNSDECFGLSMYGNQTIYNNNNDKDDNISISYFNHSCFPNCVRVQENQSISIYSLIPIKKGDELSISYIDIRMSKNDRLLHLKEIYYFECKCKRCTLPPLSNLSLEIEKTIENYTCKNQSIKCTGILYLPPFNKIQRICNFCHWKEPINN